MQGRETSVSVRLRGRKPFGSSSHPGGYRTLAPRRLWTPRTAPTTDSTLEPFAANLLRPIGSEDGHKRHKGRWARTTLKGRP